MILVIAMILGTAIYVGSEAMPRIMHEKETSGDAHNISLDIAQTEQNIVSQITKIQNMQKLPF